MEVGRRKLYEVCPYLSQVRPNHQDNIQLILFNVQIKPPQYHQVHSITQRSVYTVLMLLYYCLEDDIYMYLQIRVYMFYFQNPCSTHSPQCMKRLPPIASMGIITHLLIVALAHHLQGPMVGIHLVDLGRLHLDGRHTDAAVSVSWFCAPVRLAPRLLL